MALIIVTPVKYHERKKDWVKPHCSIGWGYTWFLSVQDRSTYNENSSIVSNLTNNWKNLSDRYSIMGKRPQQTRRQVTDRNSFLGLSSPPRELNESDPYGKPVTALLVDPSLASRKTLERLFKQHEVQVEICGKGAETVQRVTKEHFDFICVSVPLEDRTDEEWFRSLQSRASHHHTHILVFTDGDNQVGSFHSHLEFAKVFHEQDEKKYSPYLAHLIGEARKHRFVKGRVLYIDSDSRKARAVTADLQEMGLTVTQFNGTQPAYESFQQENYDLVLLGARVEDSTSEFDLVSRIRNGDHSQSQVPIVVISGIKNLSKARKLVGGRANDYVIEPMVTQELKLRVGNLLLINSLLETISVQEHKLRKVSLTDDLTSLFSRTYLLNVGGQRVNEACRQGFPLSFILLNVDNFQPISETYGDTVRDRILKDVAKLIQSFSRKEDVAARLREGEFGIMLPHCTGPDALHKIEQMRTSMESLGLHEIHITASFGLVSLPLPLSCDFEQLLSAADYAMSQATLEGGDRTVISELIRSDSGALKVMVQQEVSSMS